MNETTYDFSPELVCALWNLAFTPSQESEAHAIASSELVYEANLEGYKRALAGNDPFDSLASFMYDCLEDYTCNVIWAKDEFSLETRNQIRLALDNLMQFRIMHLPDSQEIS